MKKLRRLREQAISCWAWALEHKWLLSRYSLVGTAAWVVNLSSQAVMVEMAGTSKSEAYFPAFLLALGVYYCLLRKYVWREDHFRWQEILHWLGGVKLLQAGVGYCVYQALLALGIAYPFALTLTTLALTIPFFVLTRRVPFKSSGAEEAKA